MILYSSIYYYYYYTAAIVLLFNDYRIMDVSYVVCYYIYASYIILVTMHVIYRLSLVQRRVYNIMCITIYTVQYTYCADGSRYKIIHNVYNVVVIICNARLNVCGHFLFSRLLLQYAENRLLAKAPYSTPYYGNNIIYGCSTL